MSKTDLNDAQRPQFESVIEKEIFCPSSSSIAARSTEMSSFRQKSYSSFSKTLKNSWKQKFINFSGVERP